MNTPETKGRNLKLIRRFFVLTALVTAISGAATWYLRKVWQYRDPVRTPEMAGRVIIAPADGVVTYVKRIPGSSELPDITSASKEGWLIGITTTALDSHYAYAPLDATVTKIEHQSSDSNDVVMDLWEYFLVTWLRRPTNPYGRASLHNNERNTIGFKGDGIDVEVSQIADKSASELAVHTIEGTRISVADKIAFSERGSQTELSIFDPDADLKVDIGHQVYGGQTVVATY